MFPDSFAPADRMFTEAYTHLLAQLAEMPTFLRQSLDGLPSELLVRLPDQDKSPLLEHLWHVRDCESDLYALRIRRVLQEDRPRLEPVPVGAWPEQRGYLQRGLEPALAEFAALRSALIADLRDLGPDALSRVGERFDGSTIDVLGLIEQVAEHDRDHRGRIAAILRSYAASAWARGSR